MKLKLLEQYRGLRREIYILFFGRMVTALGSMIWPVMTMILNQKLGFSAAEISYYFVASSIIMLPASILGGKLADHVNKKWLIVCCDSVSVLCFIICSAIPLGIGTIVLFVVAGVFQSAEWPAYDALFADLTKTKDRTRAYSLDYMGQNLGLVLSPTIAGLLFKDYLWLSFLISGVAIGISTLMIAILIRDITPVDDAGEEAEYQKKKEGVGVFTILKENPLIALYLVCGTLYAGAYGQYNFIMPLDLAGIHGENGAVIFGTVSSFNCITVVLFTPIITRVLAKVHDTGKIFLCRVLIFSGYVIFILVLGFIPGYYLAMLVFTWGEICAAISEEPYISKRIPASHRGRINGIMSVAYTAITGFIDLGVGQLYDHVGSTGTWVFVLGVTTLSAVLALVLRARDKKRYPKLYLEGADEDAKTGEKAEEGRASSGSETEGV